jgi:hypothetical protein
MEALYSETMRQLGPLVQGFDLIFRSVPDMAIPEGMLAAQREVEALQSLVATGQQQQPRLQEEFVRAIVLLVRGAREAAGILTPSPNQPTAAVGRRLAEVSRKALEALFSETLRQLGPLFQAFDEVFRSVPDLAVTEGMKSALGALEALQPLATRPQQQQQPHSPPSTTGGGRDPLPGFSEYPHGWRERMGLPADFPKVHPTFQYKAFWER